MKKSVVILLVMAIVAGFAFAQDAAAPAITFGAWGRSGVNVIDGTTVAGSDLRFVSVPGWAGGSRVGVSINGNSANVGFNLDVINNGGAIAIGDNARIWVKPAAMLKLSAGKANIDNLRGAGGGTAFFGGNTAGNEDNIFQRFNISNGLMVELTPVDGLFAGAELNAGATGVLVADAFADGQYGAGYTIKDIGLLRAQYIGDANKIQAAFKYSGMAGLSVDAGFTYDLTANAQSNFTVAASYGKDALSAALRVKADFLGTADFGLTAYAYGGYNVASGVTAQIEGDYSMAGTASSVDVCPSIKMGFSNGYVGLGFNFSQSLATGGTGAFQVPLILEYWF